MLNTTRFVKPTTQQRQKGRQRSFNPGATSREYPHIQVHVEQQSSVWITVDNRDLHPAKSCLQGQS